MNPGTVCRECGAPVPADSPGGFCAQCLLGLGLSPAQESTTGSETAVPSQELKAGSSANEKLGDHIGRYKLLQEIGHGGCGVVYMAEQKEPVRRRVALKVIKLGMDTKQVVARFEAERQALALMDHANIAKVLDAGATETGRPYFVMELVGGIKITDYCHQHQLTTRQRLDLFIQVCRAIQHAHQKGVIHRDIKPSNVLVAMQDGQPVPKVIDFGIAKATQGRLTDQTLFTAFEQFLGTPAYMSPEQTQLGSLDVDTRSDIYSLGVLLYELLTGTTPFDTKDLVVAGLDEMRRTIREVEPVKPSTRLMQETSIRSALGKSEIRNPKSEIDRDLDWIVMKCLEKARARRYETVNGLALDIERHLNSEPVLAGPPSNFYRLQKLIHRNKTLVVTTAAVTLALLFGLGLSTWLFFRERSARHEQATEAAKSKQVARFLEDMLNSVSPSVALGQDTTLLRGILDKTSQRVGTELTNQPQVEIELRNILSGIYLDLSLYKEAQDTLQAGLKVARATLGDESLEVAFALANLSYAQWGLGEYEQAEASGRESLRIRSQHSAMEDLEASRALNNLGLALQGQSKLPEAEEAFRRALGIQQKVSSTNTPELAMVLQNHAAALGAMGKLEDAVVDTEKVIEMQRKLVDGAHPELAIAMNNLASLLVQLGRLSEAEQMLREVIDTQRKFFGSKHHQLAVSLYNLAACLRKEGKLNEAEDRFRESLAMVRDLFGNEHVDVASTLHGLALLLREMGRLAEAEDLLSQALAMNRKLLGDNDPETTTSLHNLRAVLWDLGKLPEAERLCEEQIAAVRAHSPVDEQKLADALAPLATTLVMEKKFSQAEPVARESLTIREAKSPEDWRTHSTRSLLGDCLLGQGKYLDAEPLLLTGYEGMKLREATIPTRSKQRLKETLQSLVQLYERTSRPDQAGEWKKKLDAFDAARNERQSK